VRANILAVAGTFFLAIAMSLALYVVGDVLYDSSIAALIATGLGVTFVALW
jgi:hypothetical protein